MENVDTFFGRPYLWPSKQAVIHIVLSLIVFVAFILVGFHFWVKPYNEALDKNPANQYHIQRVVVNQPQ